MNGTNYYRGFFISNLNIIYTIGSHGLRIVIENDFKYYMDTINTIAAGCNVVVSVTNSFRTAVTESLTPPSDHSPHLIGHAIDLVLETPSGICNNDCITGKSNSHGVCFTTGIADHPNLKWGNEFDNPEPAHLGNTVWDDGDEEYWNQLYYSNQQTCTL